VKTKRQWSTALFDDVVPALLGVLLCSMPKLKELRLGDVWLMDTPIFASMVSPDIRGALPSAWHHPYLRSALAMLLPKLEVLEVPADMSSLFFSPRAITVFDFRRFRSLREVGITMKALWWCARFHQSAPDPRELFPSTIEVLRISEATEYTPTFLSNLCTAKVGGHFPRLRRVEVYHLESLELTQVDTVLVNNSDTIEDLHEMFQDTGMILFMFLPEWELRTWELGISPWRLNIEPAVFKNKRLEAFRKFTGPFGLPVMVSDAFEQEWDADGDVVMH
jgi:hypothetical protein